MRSRWANGIEQIIASPNVSDIEPPPTLARRIACINASSCARPRRGLHEAHRVAWGFHFRQRGLRGWWARRDPAGARASACRRRATLNALDGAVIADLPQQLHRLPTDASHLVVSVGGNDALGEVSLLDQKVRSVAEALEIITQVRERFRSGYAGML